MKTVSKAIAIQMKKKKDMEKYADQGVYGKKLHANQSDVLNVQDVGRNETFNQIVAGGARNDEHAQGRKHQIKKRREALKAEKDKRRRRKGQDPKKKLDDTVSVYKECLEQMQDKLYAGYDTSETEDELEHAVSKKTSAKDPEDLELDDEAKVQLALEEQTRDRWYIISSRSNTRVYWDAFIIFFAIINGIILPLQLAFSKTLEAEDEKLKEQGTNISIV